MPGVSIGVSVTAGGFPADAAAAIITVADAGVTPAIQSVQDGDTWADLLLASATDTANYASSEGTIASAVAEISIDGGAWTALSGNEAVVLGEGDTAEARIKVTDDQANERIYLCGSTIVAGLAPEFTSTPVVVGTLVNGEILSLADDDYTGDNVTQTYDWSRRLGSEGSVESAGTGATVTAAEGYQYRCVTSIENDNGSDVAETVWTDTVQSAEITAIVPPVEQRLHEFQTLSDIANFSAIDDTDNFSSPAGSITTVEWLVNGTDQPGTYELVEGDAVVVRVTDSAANTKDWPIETATEYAYVVNATAGNEAEIQVNSLVDDAFVLSIPIIGGDYDGTYAETAAKWRAETGPELIGDTIDLTYAGDPVDLGTGDQVTANLGLWVTSTGNLTLSGQLRSDTVDVSGATFAADGDTFTLTASEEGTEIDLEVTANDGVNAATVEVGGAVNVPGVGAEILSIVGQTDGIHVTYSGTLAITGETDGIHLEVT